ncbi:GNAT family N-acetyltransferase [Actinophytocola gossypii]|uniref:GNAT family N-acetyltransferase n=1 Tax=Actinophytocola gossypii TaxID=2812003 RepID=A0ABT2JDZ0_9PSEU|nr:GNAT family protein [Actinophytocola gossypii]MCT2586108.1 GNAT family N-acetyltransferase [Actinophytocola gossypii]
MLRPEYPIETARLTLRPFAETDFDALHAYQKLPEVARYLYEGPREPAETAEALERRIARTSLEKAGDVLVLAVVLRETGELLGEVNLCWLSESNRQGEFGFVFNPAFHGNGYAGEAAVEMLRLGFDGLGLHRIIGRCEARNTASARLMARLGLRREAHFVQNEFVKGEWNDEVVFAMLATEWADARP